TILTAAASSGRFTAQPLPSRDLVYHQSPVTPPRGSGGDRHGAHWAKRRQAACGGWREDRDGADLLERVLPAPRQWRERRRARHRRLLVPLSEKQPDHAASSGARAADDL